MAALATLCTLCALLMAGGADSAGEPHSSRKFKTRQPHGSDRRPPEEEYPACCLRSTVVSLLPFGPILDENGEASS